MKNEKSPNREDLCFRLDFEENNDSKKNIKNSLTKKRNL